MRHMILAALCIWSCIMTVTPLLTEEKVARVTDYIQQHFTKDFNYQYSYFVKFTEDECIRGLTNDVLQEALGGEDASAMYHKVDAHLIYKGKRMVVTSHLRYKKSHKKHNLQAEYRLLESELISPISTLLTDGLFAGCSIFYSFYSPCTTKCSLPDGNYNIIDQLDTINGLPKDRAFVFGKALWYDAERPSKSRQVWDSWRSLNSHTPLFRCAANNCVQCFKNGVHQNHCYNV
ncbi:uncharacterized protein LOC130360489 [Hyla sarda]|uniref:uncharacterized protein LOC130360489 n=1 Tax=Hyla sarda TaxID=327740 RepID=UPI0024C26822|nr:uncharacterized protein LOC130360489 [Hyla sarda]